jgi:hypothetical protein
MAGVLAGIQVLLFVDEIREDLELWIPKPRRQDRGAGSILTALALPAFGSRRQRPGERPGAGTRARSGAEFAARRPQSAS